MTGFFGGMYFFVGADKILKAVGKTNMLANLTVKRNSKVDMRTKNQNAMQLDITKNMLGCFEFHDRPWMAKPFIAYEACG